MKIYPIFLPNYGCKYNCIYCDQKKITNKNSNIEQSLNEAYTYLKNSGSQYDEIAFFGGTFTYLNFNIQNKILKKFKEFIDNRKAKGFRISTLPDCIDKNILNNLKDKHVTTIELGVQSLYKDVLLKCNRKYDYRAIKTNSILIKKFGFKLGHQLMFGLPGSNFFKDIKSIKKSLQLKPDYLRVYPLVVIRNTELEQQYKKKIYKPLTKNYILKAGYIIIDIISKTDTKLIKFGLHSESNFTKNYITAGYYSSSLKNELIQFYIKRKLKKITKKIKDYTIETNSNNKFFLKDIAFLENKIVYNNNIPIKNIIIENNNKKIILKYI